MVLILVRYWKMNLKRLLAEIKSLPQLDVGPDTWLRHRRNLRQQILSNPPRDFLNWSVIQATMYVGQAPYIQQELDAVLDCYPSDVLKPGDYFSEPGTYNDLSTNLIHQAYHLLQYESKLGVRTKDFKTILEFGGGYGAMCLLVHRLGFTGEYVIYDLPEFNLLQEYYLSKQDVKATYLSELKQMDVDLFIALHSLGEIDDTSLRWEYLDSFPALSYLFSYTHNWNDVENVGWFDEVQNWNDNYEWISWKIEHLPGRYYLVGAV